MPKWTPKMNHLALKVFRLACDTSKMSYHQINSSIIYSVTSNITGYTMQSDLLLRIQSFKDFTDFLKTLFLKLENHLD